MVNNKLQALMWGSAAVRLSLVLWGEVQDRTMQVKYTDIDYVVFTDAARFVYEGGSPYDRSTYRYSPLLAYLLLPNILVHGVWGKVLFSAGDILAAWLIVRVLRRQGASEGAVTVASAAWLCNPFTATISTRGSCDVLAVVLLLALIQLLLSRPGPPVILPQALKGGKGDRKGARVRAEAVSPSIRGGYPSPSAILLAAFVYGLVVHLRIYPIIFAPTIVFFLASRALSPNGEIRPLWSQVTYRPVDCLREVIVKGLSFGGASALVFFVLGAACYGLYGQRFLDEAFLHHVTRRDPRHNFSPHFYPIYLEHYGHQEGHAGDGMNGTLEGSDDALSSHHPGKQLAEELLYWMCASSNSGSAEAGHGVIGDTESSPAVTSSLSSSWELPDVASLTSVVQMLAQLVLAGALHGDLPGCMLLQTITFVALNKVCTAQYFVWYFGLLPLVVPRIPWPIPRGLQVALGVWVVCQLHWLFWGYMLEFQGLPVHLMLWSASIIFLAANTFIVVQMLRVLYGSDAAESRKDV